MTKIHDFEKIFIKRVKKIEELKTFSENKDSILRFKDYLLSEGIGYAKITKYMQDLRRFDGMINKKFVDVDEQDVRKAVSELNL